jgi:oligosaccharide repeat unit polymerase
MYLSRNYQDVIEMVIIGYLFINIGFLIGSWNIRQNNPVLNQYTQSIRRKSVTRFNLKISSYIFIAIGLIASVIFFIRAGNIPILALNKESARVAALAVSGNGYFLYLMSIGMYGIALLAVYSYFYKQKKVPLFLLLLFIGLAMTGTGSRRYILWICLYVLIAKHYLSSPIPKKQLIIYTFLGLLFVNVFEMFRNPDSLTTVNLSTTFSYRFLTYISNLEKVITYFISRDQFEYGGTFIMDILTALPGKQIDYQSWLKQVTNLEFEGFGIPPTIMGDLYVNFAYPGVIIGCTLFGFIIRIIYNKLILEGGSLLNVFIYMLVLEIASKIITSGLSAQSISILWLGIFITFQKLLFRHLSSAVTTRPILT